jgi:transcriptional regulator with XRE-family HTH domain
MQTVTFGRRLQALRETCSLSRRDLAARVRLSETYLEKIERGYSPPPAASTIADLARVLQADADELFSLSGKLSPDVERLLIDVPMLVQLVRVAASWEPDTLAHFLTSHGVEAGRLLHGAGITRRADGASENRCQRQPITAALRTLVFKLDSHECVYCSAQSVLEVDHIFPVSMGGTDEPENLVTCCHRCNNKKKNRQTAPPMVFGRFRASVEQQQ